jgi:hypothetical protein
MEVDDHQPGDDAPHTEHYEELNVFGSPTGTVVHRLQGEPLPSSPRGFTWLAIKTTNEQRRQSAANAHALADSLPDSADRDTLLQIAKEHLRAIERQEQPDLKGPSGHT